MLCHYQFLTDLNDLVQDLEFDNLSVPSGFRLGKFVVAKKAKGKVNVARKVDDNWELFSKEDIVKELPISRFLKFARASSDKLTHDEKGYVSYQLVNTIDCRGTIITHCLVPASREDEINENYCNRALVELVDRFSLVEKDGVNY